MDVVLPDSRVFSLLDGLLGSPVPRVLVAVTLNSYSVQGNKSTTLADSAFPSTSAGAAKKNNKKIHNFGLKYILIKLIVKVSFKSFYIIFAKL